MRNLVQVVLLLAAACGDNIHPIAPDARPDAAPDAEVVFPSPATDPRPEPPAPPCDKHETLNGHKHKCQHRRPHGE